MHRKLKLEPFTIFKVLETIDIVLLNLVLSAAYPLTEPGCVVDIGHPRNNRDLSSDGQVQRVRGGLLTSTL